MQYLTVLSEERKAKIPKGKSYNLSQIEKTNRISSSRKRELK